MREVNIPEKIEYESEAPLGRDSFNMKSILMLIGSAALAFVLSLFVYAPLRWLFGPYFVGLFFYMLKSNKDLHYKKNWQAYWLILRKDKKVYH